jgi:hypothetical protein
MGETHHVCAGWYRKTGQATRGQDGGCRAETVVMAQPARGMDRPDSTVGTVVRGHTPEDQAVSRP